MATVTQPRPADRIRKLVTLAASAPSNETAVACTKAHQALGAMDTTLLDTLAGQRERLLKKLWDEHRRLISSKARANKTVTGELVGSAAMLFSHYERHDALIAAVMLTRMDAGHTLTNTERQQLDGPQPWNWPF